ncbi:MAG: pilus assembly protein CpaE [Novosphingobium lindaniclasticum]|jgi:pilus assembly protein CpaE|uniref:AAA family ATPase n=1 Tax=Novosphingobium lindaniclasticum TaxID=1329895 RepID=UPI00240969D9|nr:pilus assembly protein CpaE [Novosphingobium lindaniclasticum]MDF2639908.1 pilus assembly protein CpaE [Novosphingobium lindaniclasticum]
MGKNVHFDQAGSQNGGSGRSAILVVASQAVIEEFRAGSQGDLVLGLHLLAMEPHAFLPAHLLQNITMAVIEVHPEDQRSMARLTRVCEAFPTLPVVAAISDASVALARALVREGIRDVVSLPLDLDEILQISLDTLARQQVRIPQTGALAPVLAVTRSISGCGATSIATHLAADLAGHEAGGKGTVIVDLDLQFGHVGHYLGTTARGNLNDLLAAGNRLDEELLGSVLGAAGGGLWVIAAPEAIMPLEAVDTDQLLRVIHLLRQRFDHVVLDMPANWTNWTLSAAAGAEVIVLVVELSIASLREARRRLDLFASVGIAPQSIAIVVNRAEKRLFRTIDVSDAARTLGHAVLGTIALDAPQVEAAQAEGRLVGQVQRKSRFAADVRTLAETLRTGLRVGEN